MLPGVDDGAADLSQALEMARIAVSEGVTVVACTPHMMPGVYDNRGPDVRARVEALQAAVDEAGLPLQLVAGADVHVAPDVVQRLRADDLATPANAVIFEGWAPADILAGLRRVAAWSDAQWSAAEAESLRLAPQFGPQVFADAVEAFVRVFEGRGDDDT